MSFELALERNQELLNYRGNHNYSVIYEDAYEDYVDRPCYGAMTNARNTNKNPIQYIADVSSVPGRRSDRTIKYDDDDWAFLEWLWNESLFAPLFLIKNVEEFWAKGQVIDASYRPLAILAALFAQRLPRYYSSGKLWVQLQDMGFTKHQAFVLCNMLHLEYSLFRPSPNVGVIDWYTRGCSYAQFLAFWDGRINRSTWVYSRPRANFYWSGTNRLFHSKRGAIFPEDILKAKGEKKEIATRWGSSIIFVIHCPIDTFKDDMFARIEELREKHGQ